MEDKQDNRLSKLRNLQLAEIELIKIFVDICEKENLKYYMLGGTMLGAIRHKGYIPWDDDADFGLVREDYDTFLRVAPKYLGDNVKLTNFMVDKNVVVYFSRLVSLDNQIVVTAAKNQRVENVWIDIFPLDGMPNNKLLFYLHKFSILAERALYKFSVFDDVVDLKKKDRPVHERILIFLGRNFPIQKLLSPAKRWIAFDKTLKKYPTSKSDWLLNAMGCYKFREMFPKSVFGDGALYDFEGMKLYGPQDYDFYLTQLYGDYMTPPPEGERNKHSTEFLEESD